MAVTINKRLNAKLPLLQTRVIWEVLQQQYSQSISTTINSFLTFTTLLIEALLEHDTLQVDWCWSNQCSALSNFTVLFSSSINSTISHLTSKMIIAPNMTIQKPARPAHRQLRLSLVPPTRPSPGLNLARSPLTPAPANDLPLLPMPIASRSLFPIRSTSRMRRQRAIQSLQTPLNSKDLPSIQLTPPSVNLDIVPQITITINAGPLIMDSFYNHDEDEEEMQLETDWKHMLELFPKPRSFDQTISHRLGKMGTAA